MSGRIEPNEADELIADRHRIVAGLRQLVQSYRQHPPTFRAGDWFVLTQSLEQMTDDFEDAIDASGEDGQRKRRWLLNHIQAVIDKAQEIRRDNLGLN